MRNSQFALEQAQARVDAAQKARDLAQRTFDITKQEQKLGAKSSVDTLIAENALAQAESALDAAADQRMKRRRWTSTAPSEKRSSEQASRSTMRNRAW